MPLANLVFLTPFAAVVGAAVVLPLAAFAVAERRVAAVRRTLRLRHPRGGVDFAALASLAAVVLLLALAAAQPAVSSTRTERVRTDAEALFVVDISQSMAASAGRTGRTRLARAMVAAQKLRSAIADVPAGVATLTDRVLPNLFPVPDAAAFDATIEQTVAINQPPPRELNVRATNFAALADIPQSGYFPASAKHRVVVLLTDGESGFFDPASVGKGLGTRPRTDLLAVQFWGRNEAIYAASGRSDPNYRPDPASKTQLAALAEASHGRVFTEGQLGQAASTLRSMLGSGSTTTVGTTRATRPLAPIIALLALLPLAAVFVRNVRLRPS
jgi:hypothetical protein